MQTVALGIAPPSRSIVPEPPSRQTRPQADGFGLAFEREVAQRKAERKDTAADPSEAGGIDATGQAGAMAPTPASGPALDPDDRQQDRALAEAAAEGEMPVIADAPAGSRDGAEGPLTDATGRDGSGWAASWFEMAAQGAMPAAPPGDPAPGSAASGAGEAALPGLPGLGKPVVPAAPGLDPGVAAAAADVADLAKPAAVQTAVPAGQLAQTVAALVPGGLRPRQEAILGKAPGDPAAASDAGGRDMAALPGDLPLSDAGFSGPAAMARAERMGASLATPLMAMGSATAGAPSAAPLVDLALAASALADSAAAGAGQMGLSPAGPGLATGAAPAAVLAPVLTPVLAQVALPLAQALVRQTPGTTEIALSPAELGQVRLTLQADAQNPERVVVQMTFDRPETLDLFRRNGDLLAAALREAGYAGADLSFGQSDAGSGRGPGADHRAQGGRDGTGFAVLDDGAPAPGPARATPLHAGTAGLDLRL
jgi:hypothetical protein